MKELVCVFDLFSVDLFKDEESQQLNSLFRRSDPGRSESRRKFCARHHG